MGPPNFSNQAPRLDGVNLGRISNVPLRDWFNGRTTASQAVDTGSIPVSRFSAEPIKCLPFEDFSIPTTSGGLPLREASPNVPFPSSQRDPLAKLLKNLGKASDQRPDKVGQLTLRPVAEMPEKNAEITAPMV